MIYNNARTYSKQPLKPTWMYLTSEVKPISARHADLCIAAAPRPGLATSQPNRAYFPHQLCSLCTLSRCLARPGNRHNSREHHHPQAILSPRDDKALKSTRPPSASPSDSLTPQPLTQPPNWPQSFRTLSPCDLVGWQSRKAVADLRWSYQSKGGMRGMQAFAAMRVPGPASFRGFRNRPVLLLLRMGGFGLGDSYDSCCLLECWSDAWGVAEPGYSRQAVTEAAPGAWRVTDDL